MIHLPTKVESFLKTGLCKDQCLPDTVQLNKPSVWKNIGSFEVTDQLVVGEGYYSTIGGMKKGKYNAYQVDDNLLIVHDSKKISKNDINKITFYSSNEVMVDGGKFGFFDLGIIKKINSKKNQGNIPFISINDKDWDGIMVTVNDIYAFTTREKNNIKKKFDGKLCFGVIKGTGTGDGIFSCYHSGDDMAILIGGETEEKLLTSSK